jgi:hypothetical protein
MFRLLTRVQIAYVALFFLVSGGVVVWEALYVWPAERCEADGGWWSMKYRQCGTPVPIWRITGREPHAPRVGATAPTAADPEPR